MVWYGMVWYICRSSIRPLCVCALAEVPAEPEPCRSEKEIKIDSDFDEGGGLSERRGGPGGGLFRKKKKKKQQSPSPF